MPEPARRMTTRTDPHADPKDRSAALYRLLAWLSPSFPTGAFSYSHGLEAAAEAGTGAAFLATHAAAWPDPFLEAWNPGEGVCLPAAFGAAAGSAGIAIEDALLGYLHTFASNLISAGLRLGLIGQTDGQRILAALEPLIASAADAAKRRGRADFGSATFAVDLASMAHETQYSRLFRS
jgi:urease accessory protein